MSNLRAYLRVNTGHQSDLDFYDKENKTNSPPQNDDYLTKIIKYIPGEIVAAYLFAMGSIGEYILSGEVVKGEELTNDQKFCLKIMVFIALLILTPVYRYLAIKLPGIKWDRSALVQAIIAMIAFAAWAYALGGPFDPPTNSNWHPTYGSLVLLGTTLALPLFEYFIPKPKQN